MSLVPGWCFVGRPDLKLNGVLFVVLWLRFLLASSLRSPRERERVLAAFISLVIKVPKLPIFSRVVRCSVSVELSLWNLSPTAGNIRSTSVWSYDYENGLQHTPLRSSITSVVKSRNICRTTVPGALSCSAPLHSDVFTVCSPTRWSSAGLFDLMSLLWW